MKILQQQDNIFLKLKISIFQNIIQYLNPKDISSFVLTSRDTRLLIGTVVKDSLKEQQQYLKLQKEYLQRPEQVKILEYSQIIQQNNVFSNEQFYLQFIQLMNSKNIGFFKDFLSIVLNRNIKIDPKEIQKQKNGLQQIHADIYQSLQNLENALNYSDYKVTNYQYIGYFSSTTKKLIEFTTKLLKSKIELQQINNIGYLFKECFKIKQYTDMYNGIEKLCIKQQYKNSIYYLNKKKCYHNYINFNLNSIILSFLTTEEIREVYKVDKIFAYQIPNIIQIIKNKISLKVQQLQNHLINPILEEIYNLYQKGSKIKIDNKDIQEIRAFSIPPPTIERVFTVVFQFLDKQIQQNMRNTFIMLCQDNQFRKFIFDFQIFEMSQKQYDILDTYIANEDQRLLQMVSLVSFKVYLQLKVNYLIKKHDIKQEFLIYLKEQNIKENLQKYLTQLNDFKIQQ